MAAARLIGDSRGEAERHEIVAQRATNGLARAEYLRKLAESRAEEAGVPVSRTTLRTIDGIRRHAERLSRHARDLASRTRAIVAPRPDSRSQARARGAGRPAGKRRATTSRDDGEDGSGEPPPAPLDERAGPA